MKGRTLSSTLFIVPVAFLIILLIASLSAPLLGRHLLKVDLFEQNLPFGASPPLSVSIVEREGEKRERLHLLGTDELGRDLFLRLLYGCRVSIMVGIMATIVSMVIGTLYGSISGLAGRGVDNLLMRIVDILYGLPFIFFVIIIVMVFGRSIYNIFIALGLIQWLTPARVVRGEVISLRKRRFIEAARAGGMPFFAILFIHIIPNILPIVVVYSTMTVPAVILEESFLSFLGLGVQPPYTSLGLLLSEGCRVMEVHPWLLILPGLLLSLILISLYQIGDFIGEELKARRGE